ncbi:hypothetical protein Tco_0352265 [Tanacetum coccineum]
MNSMVNVEQVAGEALRNNDDDNLLGSLQVVLTDPDALDCSNCQEPLTTPIYQVTRTTGNLVCNVYAAHVEENAANYGNASGSDNENNGENDSSGQKGNKYTSISEGGDNGFA